MEEKNGKLSVVVSPEKSKKFEVKRNFWHINRDMLPYKLHYFLFSAGGGAVYPFTSAFGITVLGLTASNIAASYTTLQVSMLVLKPSIGYMADYFNRLKAVTVGLALLKTIFCFLLISIPGTGMPGVHITQFVNISQSETYCQLCFNPGELGYGKKYVNDEVFRQIYSCFNNNGIQSISIQCLTNSSEESMQIRQVKCDMPYKNSALSTMNTAFENNDASKHALDILYIKDIQGSSICLLPRPAELDPHGINLSTIDVNQFCQPLSNESVTQLQQLFANSDFRTTNCSDPHKEIRLEPKDEPSIGMANFKTYQFWAFLICVSMASTVGSSEFTMADTACYESNPGINFGQQRVWSAIGWGLVAPFAGFLNDYTESYVASSFVLACFSALEIWNLCRMNLIKPNFTRNFLKDMKTVFSSVEFLCFSAGVLMNGMFTGIIFYYLTWFVLSIGGNKLIVGLMHTIQCIFGEVPGFYFSKWLLEKLGHFNLVSLALLCHGIRFFLYSYLHNPWWILPIECLQGFTYGSFVTALTSYGKLNSKPGTEATMQSILAIIFDSLGCGIGCAVTGVCLEYFGGHTTFFYASCFCVFATMINVFSTLIIGYQRRSEDVFKSTANSERY